MNLNIRPGKYVIAVSGGVDSVVLLHVLTTNNQQPTTNNQLVVAHFDHGIRENSSEDRKFVEKLAKKYGLEFFYAEGKLGSDASEAEARAKRYEFLEKIKKQTGSSAIVTAHHQDDLLETIVINLLRGTGRKGLSSLSDRPSIKRPLLGFPKSRLLEYAKKHKLQWREDETNIDQKYLRNFIRHNLMKNLSSGQKKDLLGISRRTKTVNEEIDELVENLFLPKDGISRKWFASLSHNVAAEVLAKWLRDEKIGFDKKSINRLVISLKTVREGKIIQIARDKHFIVQKGIIRMNTSGAV